MPPVGEEGDGGSLPTLGMALADGSVRLMEVVEGGREGERRVLLRETARCFPLKVGGGDEEEKEEQEGEEAAASFPSTSSQHPLDDPRAMALYLDVNQSDPNRIAVSFSDGRVAVLEAISTMSATAGAAEAGSSKKKKKKTLETRSLWRAHDAECWCISFSPLDKETVYTGADDCEFLAWDLRSIGGGSGAKPRPAWRAGGGGEGKHSAGVCCISPSPTNAGGDFSLIATGSYDGRVRVWDSRSPREPLFVCASAVEEGEREEGKGETASSSPSSSAPPLGGGAWRLVWHPRGEPRLLCAAMHSGFAVLRLERGEDGDGEKARVEIEQHYRGHGADPSPLNGGAATLGYGCDWAFNDNGRLVAATASFYDNAVHLWEPR